MDGSDCCSVEYPVSKWCSLLGLKQKSLFSFLNLCEDKLKIKVCVKNKDEQNQEINKALLKQSENIIKTLSKQSENKVKTKPLSFQNIIKIEIPNLLKKRDEYSQKSGQKIDNVHPKNKEIRNKNKEIRENPIRNIILPDWLKSELWEQFKEHRKIIKPRLTRNAELLNLKKLTEFYNNGYNPKEIIETTIANGWKGFYEPKQIGGKKDGGIKPNITKDRKEYPVDLE